MPKRKGPQLWDVTIDLGPRKRIFLDSVVVESGEDGEGVGWIWVDEDFKLAPVEFGQEREYSQPQWDLTERGMECPVALNGKSGTLILKGLPA